MRNLYLPLRRFLAAIALSAGMIVLSAATHAQSVSYETRPQGLEEVEHLTAKAMRLFKSGDTKAALTAFQSAARMARQHLGESDHRYIKSLNNLALTYELSGSLDKSERIYRQAISIAEAQPNARTRQLANLQNNLAAVVLQQCRVADAQALYKRALLLSEQSLGTKHTDTAMIRDNVAQLDQYLGSSQPGRAALVNANHTGSTGINSLLQRCLS